MTTIEPAGPGFDALERPHDCPDCRHETAGFALTIPAPCEWLSSNDRRLHPVTARLVKQWRQAAGWRARAARLPRITEPVTITALVHRIDNGRADAHNAAPTLKPVLDGLVDVGVLVDDSDRYVLATTIQPGARRSVRALTVIIRPQGVTP